MRYYSTQRPISIGTYPTGKKITEIVNFNCRQPVPEIGRPAWGYIDYDEPLTEQEAADYELVKGE